MFDEQNGGGGVGRWVFRQSFSVVVAAIALSLGCGGVSVPFESNGGASGAGTGGSDGPEAGADGTGAPGSESSESGSGGSSGATGSTPGAAGTAGRGALPASEWDGKTYLVTLMLRHWVEPRGEVVVEFAPYARGFLLEVSGASTDSYRVKLAPLMPDVDETDPPPTQDPCSPTSSFAASGNSIGLQAFGMNIRHFREDLNVYATVRSLQFVDALPMNGVVSHEARFAATLDARDIAPLFTQLSPNPAPAELCDALASLDLPVPCEPCPHDGASWCVTIEATAFGVEETTLEIQNVSEAALDDPACQGGRSD
jgi:hypothetical protein